MPESFPMVGGDGTKSYTKNSQYQREVSSLAKESIDEAIVEKLDIRSLMTSASNTFRVADLGCSVGPNTFFAMKDVLDAVVKKCHSQGLSSQDLEFQVFFNDHASNDFNTLFTSLPPNRQYYAAGVPGSFYDRLFPRSSLHFAHSSYALHWLTKVPEELLDLNSSAWNKGRIHYGSASDEVAKAYAGQFAKDMEIFLNARAKEMVVGGMMVLIMLGHPDGDHRSELPFNWLCDFLGSNLMDMVHTGTITEAQVDSFNIPVYAPSVKEMTEIVGRNGCFSILKNEITAPQSDYVAAMTMEIVLMHNRAVTEVILTKHFGSEVVDELFNRASQKGGEVSDLLESSKKKGHQLFVVLKRK